MLVRCYRWERGASDAINGGSGELVARVTLCVLIVTVVAGSYLCDGIVESCMHTSLHIHTRVPMHTHSDLHQGQYPGFNTEDVNVRRG